jgi:histidinol-phosphate aminotransferase
MTFGRAILKDVEPYVPGEQPRIPGLIKLNTNENPYPPSPKAVEALHAMTERSIRQYPDPLAVDLRRACAERYGLPDESWVFAGNGMDEILAMTIRAFVDPGDTVGSTNPTYVLYETLTQLHGARYVASPLGPDNGLPETWPADARLLFVPRPNAPTGVAAPREAMENLCRNFPGIVFIDEAYADFADDNCLDFPERFENVIVGRTFSKGFSFAGMRLGIAIANPALLGEFFKTKDSYNVNAATQISGIAAFLDYDHMLGNVARVKATRRRLIDGLREMGFTVSESQSNFVLARWRGEADARGLFTQLRERAILVRYFDVEGLRDGLRITVGTDTETDALLSALKDILASS